MLSIVGMLWLASFVLTIVSAAFGKIPLWVPLLLVTIAGLAQYLPLR